MESRPKFAPIAILAMAGFVVVTTEFIIIGFLPQLAADFGVSVEQAGLLVSLFAFTVVVAGPVLMHLQGQLRREPFGRGENVETAELRGPVRR